MLKCQAKNTDVLSSESANSTFSRSVSSAFKRIRLEEQNVRYEVGTFVAVAGTGNVNSLFLGTICHDVVVRDDSCSIHWYNKLEDLLDEGFSVYERSDEHVDDIPMACIIGRAVGVYPVTIDWHDGAKEVDKEGRFVSWVGASAALNQRKIGIRLGRETEVFLFVVGWVIGCC